MPASPRRGGANWLLLGPGLILLLLLLPLAGGLAGLLLQSFGYRAPVGAGGGAGEAWRALFRAPGLWSAVGLALWSGLGSTLLALGLTCLLLVAGGRRRLARLAAPLVAVPHLALAIGLAFLVAPSGWIARLLSPWATGWDRPPDLLTLQDPWALSLILGLVVKETPFLLLIAGAALADGTAERRLAVARSLGQPPLAAWFKVVLPALYPQLRWPLFAVLAYGLTNVEIALILGPTAPPTLALLLLAWFNDADLALRPQAAAGACLQILLVLAVLLLWRAGEIAVARLGRRWAAGGPAWRGGRRLAGLGRLPGLAILALGVGSFAALVLWSLAGQWRFPAAWPEVWSLAVWQRQGADLAGTLAETGLLALAAAGLALLLSLLALEQESVSGRRAGRPARLLLYLPLLAPPVALLFGWGVLLAAAGLTGSRLAVLWTHLLYVLPYVFLALAGPWRALDPRFTAAAQALGQGRLAVLWRVKLPLLRAPILTAGAVGFAVSMALYLPTLVPGGGRIRTLATEALALSGGGDRRLVAALALLQALLPLLAFAAALWVGKPRQRQLREAA